MGHVVYFSEPFLDELRDHHDDVIEKIYNNFINPIKNGLEPPHELQGKYKPSWEMKFLDSPMKKAFVDLAKSQNLHHYHFGHQFYRTGNDPDYQGDVSDGILHIKINTLSIDSAEHVLFALCLEHPSPFKVPFEKKTDKHIAA